MLLEFLDVLDEGFKGETTVEENSQSQRYKVGRLDDQLSKNKLCPRIIQQVRPEDEVVGLIDPDTVIRTETDRTCVICVRTELHK